jgi:solute carrier family 34 (sodium-dependent phosphate cotransporter)
MIGVIATVLIQSSSTTTSIVVSLVPTIISPRQGIYLIMGANIGTTITNTLVSLGQIGNAEQLERAFAGATCHGKRQRAVMLNVY